MTDPYFDLTPYGVYLVTKLDKECLQLTVAEGHIGLQFSPHRARQVILGLEQAYEESLEKTRRHLNENS